MPSRHELGRDTKSHRYSGFGAYVRQWDRVVISWFSRMFIPFARFSIFLVFFWFGALKVFGLSPAGELARSLTERTVGLHYFDTLFMVLAIIECVIGILFLVPRATRIVIPLLLLHMGVVCSPLVLTTDLTWQSFGVPTLEGQYIIKNAVVIAVAIGIAAATDPLGHTRRNR